MRDQSDEEEGFIPSDLEIRNKYTFKLAAITNHTNTPHQPTHIKYRFADHFIKKQHSLSLNTPLTLPIKQPLLIKKEPTNNGKQQWQHPYRYYCEGRQFDLVYSKHGEHGVVNGRECMKNQVSLLNIEDKASPSLKQLKSHDYQQPDKPVQPDDLVFDSKFENGNLHSAFRKKQTHQYHLFIQNDTNTLGYNQWLKQRKRLRFFEEGQRIAMFSLKEAEQTGNGWQWSGYSFRVEESAVRTCQQKRTFSITFKLQFPHDEDYVILASSLPYSYSKLLQEIGSIQNEASKNSKLRLRVESGSSTLCCNSVPELTFTNINCDKKQKKMIVVMGRQHPGEVCSSFMAEGLMRSLLKDTPQSNYILENYIVKVFPMINVDGVIYGNFRCDVSGVDLNRRWKQPSRVFHPHLFEIKKKLIAYSKRWKIELCLDLHGHSKKYNIFCYACKHNSYTCRILPLLIQKYTSIFDMASCTYGLSRDKESTARATLSKIIKSQNVLTLQTSCFGFKKQEKQQQFNPRDLYQVADSIWVGIRHFLDKQSVSYAQAERDIRNNFSQFKELDKQNEQQSGSDSQPELDQIDFKQKLATIFDKKYEHQYKSFIKEDLTAHLHYSQLMFNHQDNLQNTKKCISSKEYQPNQDIQLNKGRKIQEQSSRKIVRIIRKNIPINEQQKKSLSINFSEIGQQFNFSQRNKNNSLKTKKSISIVKQQQNNSQLLTLNAKELRDAARQEIGRSSIFKEAHRDEDKKAIQMFQQRFQKFIPSNMILKNKAKYELLQKGLQNDDSSHQLNLMFQNKRKLQLQRIKKSIEESTQIVERQGKLKKLEKRQPIIDFRKFKQIEKTKQLMKLGEFSERYLDSQL